MAGTSGHVAPSEGLQALETDAMETQLLKILSTYHKIKPLAIYSDRATQWLEDFKLAHALFRSCVSLSPRFRPGLVTVLTRRVLGVTNRQGDEAPPPARLVAFLEAVSEGRIEKCTTPNDVREYMLEMVPQRRRDRDPGFDRDLVRLVAGLNLLYVHADAAVQEACGIPRPVGTPQQLLQDRYGKLPSWDLPFDDLSELPTLKVQVSEVDQRPTLKLPVKNPSQPSLLESFRHVLQRFGQFQEKAESRAQTEAQRQFAVQALDIMHVQLSRVYSDLASSLEESIGVEQDQDKEEIATTTLTWLADEILAFIDESAALWGYPDTLDDTRNQTPVRYAELQIFDSLLSILHDYCSLDVAPVKAGDEYSEHQMIVVDQVPTDRAELWNRVVRVTEWGFQDADKQIYRRSKVTLFKPDNVK